MKIINIAGNLLRFIQAAIVVFCLNKKTFQDLAVEGIIQRE